MRGRVGLVTMQDAERFNALAPPQVAALLAALEQSRREGARALVIASGVKHFCAGADIKALLEGGLLDPDRPLPASSPIWVFRALIEDGRPVIAAVDGLAAGGGVELTLCADLVLATDRARFVLPELGLGVLPRTALVRLPEIVGRRKALELILTRRRLDAAEALAIGLVNRLVDSAGLVEAGLALAEEIVSAPPGAIAAVKRNLGRVSPADWEGLHGLLAQMHPAEWREGLGSFLDKRAPDFDPFWTDPKGTDRLR